eukprot:4924095-Pyramimonas_sp.AAC.1
MPDLKEDPQDTPTLQASLLHIQSPPMPAQNSSKVPRSPRQEEAVEMNEKYQEGKNHRHN